MTVSDPASVDMVAIVPKSAQQPSRLHEEFCTLFIASYPQVVRTVWFVVHDRHIAEEVAQDAFTELYRNWSRVRTYDRPDLWVRRIAIRRAQRESIRRSRRVVLEQAAAGGSPPGDVEPLPDPELIAAIRDLPPKQRAIVVLFYLEDRSMTEVADLVGCTPSTGYVQLHQARKRLAAALGEEVSEDVD